MPDEVYRPARVQVRPADGPAVTALTFVANHRSPAYARLEEGEILRRLRDCSGERGRNRDYAVNTMHALRDRGIRDGRIESLVGRLE
jgi:cation transport regulator ChaC